MYSMYKVIDTVRVPPKELGKDLNQVILDIAKEEYEGLVDEDLGVVIAVNSAQKKGEGKIVPGDGGIYYSSELEMLLYTPIVHEVVEAYVTEVTEFGIFIRTGPIEGLVHVSQIMDDYINFDAKLPGFIGRETKKSITTNDQVLARTVTVSLRGSIAGSKIGYTMRQLGLGKKEWLKADEKKAEKKSKSEGKGRKERKEHKKKGGK
ncbi:MAG TPA: DNA-directed RNA polymerase [archaeon]|nr:DNA-directed RNA polymerase [archaeon]